MNKNLSKSLTVTNISQITVLILLLLLGIWAYVSYKNYSINSVQNTALETSETQGKVEGVRKIQNMEVPEYIPIIPTAQITSLDKNNGAISITFETELTEDEIKAYYAEYLSLNGWQATTKNTYTRGDQTLLLEIVNNVGKITFF